MSFHVGRACVHVRTYGYGDRLTHACCQADMPFRPSVGVSVVLLCKGDALVLPCKQLQVLPVAHREWRSAENSTPHTVVAQVPCDSDVVLLVACVRRVRFELVIFWPQHKLRYPPMRPCPQPDQESQQQEPVNMGWRLSAIQGVRVGIQPWLGGIVRDER